MRKIIYAFLLLTFSVQLHAQKMTFMAPGEVQGELTVTHSHLLNNRFKMILNVKWLNQKKEVIDLSDAYVVFHRDDFHLPGDGAISCLNFERENTDALFFNKTIKLEFKVDETIEPGDGNFRFEFPFKYVASVEDLYTQDKWNEFIVAYPRDYHIDYQINPGDIDDLTAPVISVLKPEGVSDGVRPTIFENELEVRVKVKDKSKIKNVSINQMNAVAAGNSIYTATINFPAIYGSQPININATDVNDNQAKKQFFIELKQNQEEIERMMAAQKEAEVTSDVDTLIPENNKIYDNRFALIIGNEDYQSHQKGLNYESNVEFATRDARIFREYAMKTLGVKESNIIYMENAKAVEMHRGIGQLNNLLKATEGEGEAIFYFAGHGFPDEKTKEGHIIPVDVSGTDLEFAIKLKYLYAKLYEHPSKMVTVFLDACFSGGGRKEGLLAARAIRIKPKDTYIKGNLVVISASSGNESALPYRDKGHGMFTYYLLKAIQDSKGRLSMSDLSDYIKRKVSMASIIENNKEQTPTTNISPDLKDKWQDLKLVE